MRGKLLSVSSLVVGAVLVLGACGGSSSKSGVGSSTVTTAKGDASVSTGRDGHVLEPAGANPSQSAKMVCAPEAINDIAEVLGAKSTQPNPPTWNDHVYSCDYVYPGDAKMTLSVKEMSTEAETLAYYEMLATKDGKKQDLQGLGDAAFVTKDGNAVVRKDYKVLTVDVSKLPKNFAGDTSENDAINVAATVMGCWTGA